MFEYCKYWHKNTGGRCAYASGSKEGKRCCYSFLPGTKKQKDRLPGLFHTKPLIEILPTCMKEIASPKGGKKKGGPSITEIIKKYETYKRRKKHGR